PQQAEVPMNLDPGQTNAPKMTPPPAAPAKQQPNVIVVGPNGQVSTPGAAGGAAGGAAAPAGGYYYPQGGDSGMGIDYGVDQNEPIYAGPTPELHVVRGGDTLWGICGLYFNYPWQWPKVWSYNPQITNP